jgi:hypothetical protein
MTHNMKNRFSSSARTAALSLVVAVGISAQGAVITDQQGNVVPASKKKAVAAAVPALPGGNEIGMLDQAYGLLSHADHDYDGHRKRAMHQIEDAARILGTKLSGDGKGHEKQGTSDSQLREAESLLANAVGGLRGKSHHHIEEALKQLGIALRTK